MASPACLFAPHVALAVESDLVRGGAGQEIETMTENVTNEPILAHLKLTQAKLSDHDERFSRVESELRAIKVHVARLVVF